MGDFSKGGGGSTQNRWILMGDFSKGGGEYIKPMAFDGFWNFFYRF